VHGATLMRVFAPLTVRSTAILSGTETSGRADAAVCTICLLRLWKPDPPRAGSLERNCQTLEWFQGPSFRRIEILLAGDLVAPRLAVRQPRMIPSRAR